MMRNSTVGLSARLLTLIFSLILLGMLSAGAARDGDGPTAPNFADTGKTKPALRVGVTPTGPPIVFEQGNKISGIEADLATSLGIYLDREIEYVVLDFNKLIPALLDNQIDIIMSGMSFTEMRAIRVNFSQPYMKVGQMPLVRRTDLNKYSNTLGLLNTKGKVGVEQGTTGDLFVQENFIYAERVPFIDINKAVKALEDKQIDVFVYDSPVIWWLASENESAGLSPLVVTLSEEYLSWAMRKDDIELLNSTNTFLEEFRSSGNLNKVIKKWLPYATDF